MSMVDDKTPIILDRIDKIGSDFQKMFNTKFGSMKISAKPTVLVNFCNFYFFSSAIDIKIPSTSGVLTKTPYERQTEDVDKKIPSTSGRFKKIDYNTKITEIEKKSLLVICLLLLHSVQKPQSLKAKYWMLLI